MVPGKQEEGRADPLQIGSGYPRFQLAKALVAQARASDAETSERARKKTQSWLMVIENVMTGHLDYGSRTPCWSTPAWATLEVVTGGFATGAFAAAGPVLEHELTLLRRIGPVPPGRERAALNAYFLSDDGLSALQELLRSGQYRITVPEEGALLIAAWLAREERGDEALSLLRQIAPLFPQLRFYPEPSQESIAAPLAVHVVDAPTAAAQLRATRPHLGVEAQKEAIEVWRPFQERMLALFMETVRGDWPCQTYPDGWTDRGRGLLNEFVQLRKSHRLCGIPDNPKKHFAQLRCLLEQAVSTPGSLSGRDVARIRIILKRQIAKHGESGSDRSTRFRAAQLRDVRAPMHQRLATVVAVRASTYAGGLSADEIARLVSPITVEEAALHDLPVGATMPASLKQKVRRCLSATAEELARQGIITSGEVLAAVLPQVTSSIRAQSLGDEQLRLLYASVYRAFRRRRSLLLLNLQKQVQFEELPWIAAIERFRVQTVGEQAVSCRTLVHIAVTALKAWPKAIFPNKLLQELVALAKGASVELPLVEELAVDIFAGKFSRKFVDAALLAADWMEGSLYATYYGIDYPEIAKELRAGRAVDAEGRCAAADLFAEICSVRAGVAVRASPAVNGMLVEQQQILTTQNLAAVFSLPGLRSELEAELVSMARECFRWVCRRQQLKVDGFHARLIMLKNTAYAWRQMIFFLSLQPARMQEFLQWAAEHLKNQSGPFRVRFGPAMAGLELAVAGHTPPVEPVGNFTARQFLGWSDKRHWLMPD